MNQMNEKETVTISLKGRIDSNNASAVEGDILARIGDGEYETVRFDASDLEYISSAGLRVLMKVSKLIGKKPVIDEVSPEIYDIFEVTGFTELCDIRKRRRTVSVDGCKIIGKGFYGTVYRLDEDTIIKVYDSPDSLPVIENEKKMARLAFLKGIPTAISYDVVRVGNSYGSVFELLNAKTFNDLVLEDPDHIDDYVKRYIEFMKLIHSTEAEEGELPSAKQVYLGYLESIREYISDDRYLKVKEILEAVREERGIVHGDIQMKNVMMVDDEPMLIDMDTLSMGDPVFDLAGLYVTYIEFGEDEEDNTEKFLGMSRDMAGHIWDSCLRFYFGTEDKDKLDEISDRIRLMAAVRFLFIVTGSDLKNSELGKLRIKHTTAHIDELLKRVDKVDILPYNG